MKDAIKARNPKLTLFVDWPGETYNDRELRISSVNLNYHDSIFWADLKVQSTHCDEQRTLQMFKPFVELKNG
jgi:hypothetical protein